MLERVWRKGNTFALLVGMWIDTATIEDGMEIPQKKKKTNKITLWPSNPTPRHICWGNQNWNSTNIPLFIAALFTIARTWKQPGCSSTDELIKKMWYIYAMAYYSAIKRNTYESVLMRWMNLQPFIQSEASPKEKVKYHIISRLWFFQ